MGTFLHNREVKISKMRFRNACAAEAGRFPQTDGPQITWIPKNIRADRDFSAEWSRTSVSLMAMSSLCLSLWTFPSR